MQNVIATSEHIVVVGLGATGMSVVRFLCKRGSRVSVMDTREAPPNIAALESEFPSVPVVLGRLDEELLLSATRVVMSPGVTTAHPAVQVAMAAGIEIIGDIQLFVEYVSAPLVAITGSNGKSTVTTLVGNMLKAGGSNVGVAGNIGTPALDLLMESDEKDIYVLELSSFQLETVQILGAEVATILNVSPDHMDRYKNIAEYHAAKQRIYYGARKIVINREDALTHPPLRPDLEVVNFGLDRPDLNQFGLVQEDGEVYLARGLNKLLSARELKLLGRQNLSNALAALAIGTQLGLSENLMLQALRDFHGLPHRCQWVANINNVDFVNDSKGTNVGATVAALQGLSRETGKIVLIAGGDGKGADFELLATVMREELRALVTLGRDGYRIAVIAREQGVKTDEANSLPEAVKLASAYAHAGDLVLLSPACASFDMFADYRDRGDVFINAVEELAA